MITSACSSLCLYQFHTIPLAKASHVSLCTVKRGASQVELVVKNLPVSAGDTRDVGSIPGSGRYPGIGNSNPHQQSCVENSRDRGAWWATVHRIAESDMTEVIQHVVKTRESRKKCKIPWQRAQTQGGTSKGANNSARGIGQVLPVSCLTSWNTVLGRIPKFQLGSLNGRP